MMNRDWLKISFIYVGTVIGAGFASGREIVEFFGVYGLKGVIGITVSGILFSLLGSLLLLKIYNNKIEGFDGLVYGIFGEKLGKVLDAIMIVSLYTGFSIMISGSGAIFKEELGMSFDFGIVLTVILSFLVFLFQLEGFSLVNSVLVPLLVLGIVFTSFYLTMRGGYNFHSINGINLTHKGNFFTSSLLYVGSNSLIIITVFSSLFPLMNSKKTAILGGMVGGVILYILSLSILSPMLIYYREVASMDIPMLKISNYIGNSYRKFYAIILWIAVFTTAIANGSSFINRFSNSRYKMIMAITFCISSIPLAKLGFSKLIGVIYPIFGLIGFFILIFILVVL